MAQFTHTKDRRPSVDIVADYLYDEITSLRLLPGTRISEAEIAAQFGVSRQPVRDAFARLENLGLLLIRPQKATEVKRFSVRAIEKARFIRAAVEAEVLRRAASKCDEAGGRLLDECISRQKYTQTLSDYDAFGRLDYEFHRTLCEIAEIPFAFDVIAEEKAKVDRLCMLSLRQDRMPQLIEDHERIASAVRQGHVEEAVHWGMEHLSRLDATIEAIKVNSATYFESDED